MDLRTLRYFTAVAEELHFGRAAKRLHISQPPLTRQIQKLELELGVTLLNRTKRSVTLTSTGQILQREAARIFSTVDNAIRVVRHAERGEAGSLSIGFYIAATDRLLPAILRQFKTLAPNVQFTLQDMLMSDVIEALENHSIDVGFLRPPISNPAIKSRILLREAFVVALAADNPLVKARRIRLSDLAAEPFVMFSSGRSTLHAQIVSACRAAGFDPKVVQEARHTYTVLGLVRAGAGVALVPASVQTGSGTGVVFRKIEGPMPSAEIAMAWRAADSSALLTAFRETAVKATKRLFPAL